MNLKYCTKVRANGIAASNKFLAENNSVFDAASAFWTFTNKCFETCPYKEEHMEDRK